MAPPSSRPSFRPRPIDLAKPLPIIKTSSDLRHDDDIVVNRALPTIASGVDPSEEGERHLRQALLASIYGGATAVDIPIPVFNDVQPPKLAPCPPLNPAAYVQYHNSDAAIIEQSVEYDADWLDEALAKRLDVDIELVEIAMDRLEKAQHNVDGRALIAWTAGRSVLASVMSACSEGTRKDVFTHWYDRRSKRGMSFIRFFQPPPDPNNHDPSVAFRPRERDPLSGVPRRMNTYDNYKKALVLKKELVALRGLFAMVIRREKHKKHMLSLKLLSQRLRTTDGGHRMDIAVRSVFQSDSEPVLALASALVPCRGLHLPALPVVHRKMIEKPRKLRRSKALKLSDKKKDMLLDRLPPGVDAYGYDEIGNKFLKHMRYFAGGFINFGVSPYDHRVFAASSQRNTVRYPPSEPPPLPIQSLKFVAHKLNHAQHKRAASTKIAAQLVPELALLAKKKQQQQHHHHTHHNHQYATGTTTTRRASMRVRTRVGRGGRIMLDRLSYEKERGVRVASYPASVEVGGVYTAGVPLSCASQFEHETGLLGNVRLLSGGEGEHLRHAAETLVPHMEELFAESQWPSRSGRSGRGGGAKTRPVLKIAHGNIINDDRRRLPAFAPRNEPLVSEII